MDDRDADFSGLTREFPSPEVDGRPPVSGEEPGGGGEREDRFDAVHLAMVTAELASVRHELEESKDKYIRLLAEFENFKKRTLKERAELLKYQGERIFVDLLEVVDDFERAMQHVSADGAQFRSGVELIQKKLGDLVGRWEVRGESGIGQLFDPQKHCALSRVPAGDKAPGTVVGELRKAYFYKDKLIRPAEVVVATEASDEEAVQ